MMFMLLAVNFLLTLSVGLVRSAPFLNEMSSFMSSASQSTQMESESSTSSLSSGPDGKTSFTESSSLNQEFESSLSNAESSLYQSADGGSIRSESSSNQSSQSSSLSESFKSSMSSFGLNVNEFGNILKQCSSLNPFEQQLYKKWSRQFTPNELNYVKDLSTYFEADSLSLSNDITDFMTFEEELQSAYDLLQTNDVYSLGTNLFAKKAILEKSKVKAQKAMKCLKVDTPLYKALDYCTEKDIYMLPMVLGMSESFLNKKDFSALNANVQEASTGASTITSSSVSP